MWSSQSPRPKLLAGPLPVAPTAYLLTPPIASREKWSDPSLLYAQVAPVLVHQQVPWQMQSRLPVSAHRSPHTHHLGGHLFSVDLRRNGLFQESGPCRPLDCLLRLLFQRILDQCVALCQSASRSHSHSAGGGSGDWRTATHHDVAGPSVERHTEILHLSVVTKQVLQILFGRFLVEPGDDDDPALNGCSVDTNSVELGR